MQNPLGSRQSVAVLLLGSSPDLTGNGGIFGELGEVPEDCSVWVGEEDFEKVDLLIIAPPKNESPGTIMLAAQAIQWAKRFTAPIGMLAHLLDFLEPPQRGWVFEQAS